MLNHHADLKTTVSELETKIDELSNVILDILLEKEELRQQVIFWKNQYEEYITMHDHPDGDEN